MNTHNFLIMAIPALVALGGGVLAAFWTPGHATRSLIQHFAAGVVLAALAVELLPEIEREHAPGLVLAGSFALGSLFMYGLKLWTLRMERPAALAGTASGSAPGFCWQHSSMWQPTVSSSAPVLPQAVKQEPYWRWGCRWSFCSWAWL